MRKFKIIMIRIINNYFIQPASPSQAAMPCSGFPPQKEVADNNGRRSSSSSAQVALLRRSISAYCRMAEGSPDDVTPQPALRDVC